MCLKKKKKKMSHVKTTFEVVCDEARKKNNYKHFGHILNRHALVMISAANPNTTKIECIQIGKNLLLVQQHWVNILCPIKLPEKGNDKYADAKYSETVRIVITNFTDQLMEMLLDNKIIYYEDLEKADEFHSLIATGNRYSEKMRQLFLGYLNSLTYLFQHGVKSERDFHKNAICVVHCADLLGEYLERTIK